MKALVSMIIALGLAAASTAPVFAAEKQHKAEKEECLKNHATTHMKWDQQTNKCVPATGAKEETPHT
jgi:Ni/Co efflux regulator RcnB